jgi:hypothetical protein
MLFFLPSKTLQIIILPVALYEFKTRLLFLFKNKLQVFENKLLDNIDERWSTREGLMKNLVIYTGHALLLLLLLLLLR